MTAHTPSGRCPLERERRGVGRFVRAGVIAGECELLRAEQIRDCKHPRIARVYRLFAQIRDQCARGFAVAHAQRRFGGHGERASA